MKDHFKIIEQHGRSYLYNGDEKIAECINADHNERFGGIGGWIKHIEKRTARRLEKIQSQKIELESERQRLLQLVMDITFRKEASK